MKKLIIFSMCIFLLAGCSNNTEISDNNTRTSYNDSYEITTNEYAEEKNNDLKDPVLEWYQLYNPNGYNTITGVISNPNDVDIDISYDLVYYKDGEEVARTDEKWSNFNISPNHNDVIWGNYDIPSAKDVDEVKMENITVAKSNIDSINAEIKYIETIDDKAYFYVKSEKMPTLNTIYIFEYNDGNNNKICDKGELVVVVTESVMEEETKISINTDVYEHNAYEIYYNAY